MVPLANATDQRNVRVYGAFCKCLIYGSTGSPRTGKSLNNQYTTVRPELVEGLKTDICKRLYEYGEIKHKLFWRVATERIAELILLLEAVVPPDPGEFR